MLLKRLTQYAAAQLDTPPPFHIRAGVRWMLDLDREGNPITGELVALRDPADPAGRRGLPQIVPTVGRTSAVLPLLACDKIEYALGWADPVKGQDAKALARAAKYHRAFAAQIAEWAAAEPADHAATALHAFLAAGGAARIPRPQLYGVGDLVMFRVEGVAAHASATAGEHWAAIARARKASGHLGQCLICGQESTLVKRLPRPVRPGLIPSQGYDPHSKTEHKLGNGASMISINKPAHGFNLETELPHTPVCGPCAESFTAALEHLLNHRDHHRTIGDAALIWWIAPSSGAPAPSGSTAPIRLLFQPDPEKIAVMLDAPRRGGPVAVGGAQVERFCAATMSNNSARIVVRDWIDIPLPQAEQNVATWFAAMQSVDPWTGQRRFYSLHRLLLALGRWYPGQNNAPGRYADLGAKGSRRPVWAQRELLLAALRSSPLSSAMLTQLLLRVRTDGHFDPARQALLRLCLTHTHPNQTRELPMALNDTDDTPAYLAGRMFAVLESLQYAAARTDAGTLNTTLTDRYFSRAVTNPASVLIPAQRGARAHLRKLRIKGKQTSAAFFARSLDELTSRLHPFPATLTLYDQGLWLNGYADQRNHDIARIKARGLPAEELLPDTDQPDTTDDQPTTQE